MITIPEGTRIGDAFRVERPIAVQVHKDGIPYRTLSGITDTYINEPDAPRLVKTLKSYRHMNGDYSFEEEK